MTKSDCQILSFLCSSEYKVFRVKIFAHTLDPNISYIKIYFQIFLTIQFNLIFIYSALPMEFKSFSLLSNNTSYTQCENFNIFTCVNYIGGMKTS
jgi:hypothetical protein